MTDYNVNSDGSKITMTIEQPVGISNRTVAFVDELFYYRDGHLHGAKGTRMCPVTQAEVDRRIAEAKDYEWSPIAHIYDEEDTPQSWDEWVADIPEREWYELAIDPSYSAKYGEAVKRIAVEHMGFDTEPEHVECVGGGRMFGSNSFDTVLDQTLLRMAHDAESDSPEWVKPFL